MDTLTIQHHGAINGVTGSCHELSLGKDFGILIDCGLFQGAEVSGAGAAANQLQIDFPLEHIKALVVTHVHIDHVGRIPYLLAAGFKGPILCSQPSAQLLPLVLEDAVKIGFSRDPALVKRFIKLIRKRIIALPYKHWFVLKDEKALGMRLRLQPAGHILGSAYVECDARVAGDTRRVVFSGDLGAPYAPLLPAPRSPYRCDTLVIESTYGNRLHPNRRTRKAALKAVIERALRDKGVVLIPAFSIGRTQEILYELESIIAAQSKKPTRSKKQQASKTKPSLDWSKLAVIVDSPLAARFTECYQNLKPFWDAEALASLKRGRHPLDFDQLITVGSHLEHERMLRRLEQTNEACVVIAASGMCAGGRIVNYLKALITEPRTDVLFIGYQAQGTPGCDILKYGKANADGSRNPAYVDLDGERYPIRAGIHQLGGYSAHADQQNLLNFAKGMRGKPTEVRLVHGDDEAKLTLKHKMKALLPECKVWIP